VHCDRYSTKYTLSENATVGVDRGGAESVKAPVESQHPWATEWTILALLYAGFWDKRFGLLGAIGSAVTFFTTLTIIPFIPNKWDPVAGFPAKAGLVPFLMKDLVLLAVSIYLLKQDVIRISLASRDTVMDSARQRTDGMVAAE
jgi:uncharacterized membrane protein YkgB